MFRGVFSPFNRHRDGRYLYAALTHAVGDLFIAPTIPKIFSLFSGRARGQFGAQDNYDRARAENLGSNQAAALGSPRNRRTTLSSWLISGPFWKRPEAPAFRARSTY